MIDNMTKNMIHMLRTAILASLLPCSVLLAKPLFASNIDANPARLDALTSQALRSISGNHWDSATGYAEELVRLFPDYSLGHWLLAEAHRVQSMDKLYLTSVPSFNQTHLNLLLEARTRLQHMAAATSQVRLPTDIIQSGRHITHTLLVDLDSSELFLYNTAGDEPVLVQQHYVSSGKAGFGKRHEGDNKTPLGIYSIRGFRSDKSLPELYGSGALILDYPNALDKALGRTGSGIWLHGIPPHDRSRSPRSSEGCVTMSNEHLLNLRARLDMRATHIILSRNLQWSTPANRMEQQERFQELFEQYQEAWLAGHTNDLHAIYTAEGLPAVLAGSTAKVTRVSSENSQPPALPGVSLAELAKVDSASISILRNPGMAGSDDGMPDTVVMVFETGGERSARVTQYWVQDQQNQWKILRETIDSPST